MSSRPTPEQPSNVTPQATDGSVVVMRLYVADGGPNSTRAIANLTAICHEHLAGRFELDIIDVLEDPKRALADGILLTPSLVKRSPVPTTTTVGNLDDTASVLRALGVL